MSNLEFAVGKRVVCIDDANWPRTAPRFRLPVRGSVYTIREIELNIAGRACLRFAEIINPPVKQILGHWDEPVEVAFGAHRFRPVRETSIDCFTALLERPPVKQTEDA